jgi:hypothetical protein
MMAGFSLRDSMTNMPPLVQETDAAGAVLAGYLSLKYALGPFIEEQLREIDGPKWLELHNKRRRSFVGDLRSPHGTVRWDPYAALKSIDVDFDAVFGRTLEKREEKRTWLRSLVKQLVRLRNDIIAHPDKPFDASKALLFLNHCRELYDFIGTAQYVAYLDKLLEEFKAKRLAWQMWEVGGYSNFWPENLPLVQIFIDSKPGCSLKDEIWVDVRSIAGRWGDVDEIVQTDQKSLRVDLIVEVKVLKEIRSDLGVQEALKTIPEIERVIVIG